MPTILDCIMFTIKPFVRIVVIVITTYFSFPGFVDSTFVRRTCIKIP